MKLSYELRAVCGVVYTQGNLVFDNQSEVKNYSSETSNTETTSIEIPKAPLDSILYTAIGHRVNAFDLIQGQLTTLPFGMKHRIDCISISPDKRFMLLVEKETDYAVLVNLRKGVVMKHFKVKEGLLCSVVKFTPDSKFVVFAGERIIEIWALPQAQHGKASESQDVASDHMDSTTDSNFRLEFLPLRKVKEIRAHTGGGIVSLEFLNFSQARPHDWYILTASSDMTARILLLEGGYHLEEKVSDENVDAMEEEDLLKNNKYEPPTLRAHKDPLVGAYYVSRDYIMTVSREGAIYFWHRQPHASKKEAAKSQGSDNHYGWLLVNRSYLNLNQSTGKVISCAYHDHKLAIGLSSGIFQLVKVLLDDGATVVSDFILILQTLNVFKNINGTSGALTALTFDGTGQWIAIGNASKRAMAVYEWASETFILKQQGEPYNGLVCAAASGDPQSLHGAGMIVATGDTTGKIALYDPTCHLSFLSFSSGASDPDPSISSASARSGHSGRITSLVFAKGSQVLLSASVDGTVRAHDLLRYRPSFRVMTTPPHEDGSSLGLSHVMADPSGEFILAIGMNSPFAMYCWHLKTGKLMDLFSGHEAPITATAMDPLGRYCLTGSLDKTVRIWTLFTDANSAELTRSRHESTVLDVGTEITSLAFSPDGKHFLIASLSGLVTAYNTESQLVKFTLSAALDLPHTRSTNDLMVAKNKASQSYYSTVTYSKDGALIVAAGNGPFLVLYEAVTGIFLKVISMSDSLLLDGTLTRLNSKATPVYKNTSGLPGTSTSSLDRRSFFPEMRISHLDFLPDSRTFIALTTEGLSMYSLDGTAFSWQLPHNSILVEGQDITPETIRNCSDPITAFILALSIYDRDKNSARYLLLNPTKKSPSTTKEEVVSVIMSICLALPTTCKYYERILNLLADAFSTNMFNATSDASADTSMMMMVTSFPIDILLTWLNQLLLIHGHGIKQFVGASHSHMARLAASTSTATAAANSSENSVLLVSSNRTASVIIPSLTSLQSSIRKIYQPLMKVTSENTFMLKFLEESLCDH